MSNCYGEVPVIKENFTGIISSSEVAAEAEAPPTLAFFGLDFCKSAKNIASPPVKKRQ